MQRTTLKNSGRLPEDEIGGSFHITIHEILTAEFSGCINGILISQKTAVAKHTAITLNMQGNCLSNRPSRILDGHIFQNKIAGINFQGIGIEGTVTSTVHFIEVIAKGDNGFICTFANNRQLGISFQNSNFLFVNSIFNTNGNSLVGENLARIDGFLNGSEIA